MMNTTTNCHDDARRATVRAHRDKHGHPDLNGLDYVEVAGDQTTLTAYFLGKLPPQLHGDRSDLLKHLRIDGGRRIRNIQIIDIKPHIETDSWLDDYLTIYVDQPGDFSTYTLRLVDLTGIDPHYDRADFSFKVDCPSDLDCAVPATCPPPTLVEPDINYLAKDYASFRQLILDRLALIMPQWQERHVPDLGIALVEVLAYVGDQLSLLPGRSRNRSLSRYRAPAHLGAAPHAPRRLSAARRLQCAGLGVCRYRSRLRHQA